MTRLPTAPQRAASKVGEHAQSLGSEARRAGRAVHPWAWWAWALCSATAVSLAHHPWLILLVIAAVVLVVIRRRGDEPWARSVRAYFAVAGVVLAIRLAFQVIVGDHASGTVLFRLPEVPLPAWAAGIRLGGPVTLEGLAYASYDAARLAAMLICVGAANALANPKRVLRVVPAAFHQVSTAIAISLSVAPQLVESAARVHRARKLRGRVARGVRGALSLVVPVLTDAIERSLHLAASMESRGYGRTRHDRSVGAGASIALLCAMTGLLVGVFWWLSGHEPLPTRWPVIAALAALTAGRPTATVLIAASIAVGVWALRESGRRLDVSHYRPDPWGWPEYLVSACGLGALTCTAWLALARPGVLTPSTDPLAWPGWHPMIVAAVLLVAAPAVCTPPPPRSAPASPALERSDRD